MRDLLRHMDVLTMRVLRWVVTAAIIAIFVLLLLGVLVRAVPLFSMSGYDEVVEFLFAWAVFLGAVVLWREGAHFRVELLGRLLAPRAALATAIAVHLLMLAFALVFAYEGGKFAFGTTELAAFLPLPKSAWYASMPVAGTLMVLVEVGAIRRLFATGA